MWGDTENNFKEHEFLGFLINVTGAYIYWLCESSVDFGYPENTNFCKTFIQCWTNAEDFGPTLYICYSNVLCLLGMNIINDIIS